MNGAIIASCGASPLVLSQSRHKNFDGNFLYRKRVCCVNKLCARMYVSYVRVSGPMQNEIIFQGSRRTLASSALVMFQLCSVLTQRRSLSRLFCSHARVCAISGRLHKLLYLHENTFLAK